MQLSEGHCCSPTDTPSPLLGDLGRQHRDPCGKRGSGIQSGLLYQVPQSGELTVYGTTARHGEEERGCALWLSKWLSLSLTTPRASVEPQKWPLGTGTAKIGLSWRIGQFPPQSQHQASNSNLPLDINPSPVLPQKPARVDNTSFLRMPFFPNHAGPAPQVPILPLPHSPVSGVTGQLMAPSS